MHDINILCGFKTKRARKNHWTRSEQNLPWAWQPYNISNILCGCRLTMHSALLHRLVLKSFVSFFFFLFNCFIFSILQLFYFYCHGKCLMAIIIAMNNRKMHSFGMVGVLLSCRLLFFSFTLSVLLNWWMFVCFSFKKKCTNFT